MIHPNTTDPKTSLGTNPVTVRRTLFLIAAALQVGCGVVFVIDVISEWKEFDSYGAFEALAVLGLAIGAFLSLREYRSLLRRNTKVERELNVASGAFQEVIEQHFDSWALTPAERDVALFLIKGLSISEIAALRNTRDGTIKAQSAAIYRKTGVSSRTELISVMVEELISGLSVAKRSASL
ncbi:helix-turn-helix transcriptional regulator [Pseudorhodobacter ferrugineus]|uniref:helix-turn-helix transcriptional regulator n=1 Tax=Pseudorhodobacter ferrugineus TaxID=77008 RepID=UPI0003B78E09|nr:LuxR C-terminal-related transcriptional regulator [Pseudorhodobacter ferrugineus]